MSYDYEGNTKMLRTNAPAGKPDVARAVADLLREDSSFDQYENRSAHRENLVRAVAIKLRDPESVVQGFSRNVSATGIGLISSEPIQSNATAVLTVSSLGGADLEFLAECRWCKEYGERWHFSGWQFVKLQR
jgi:hypothetical protein